MDEKRPLIYSAISSHHFSTIMEKLYFQYKDGRNCDLEIKVTDGRIFAHKCLVDIFFTEAATELDDDRFVLDLADFDELVVTALLDMMYTGELCIQPHLIKSLQEVALQLGFTEACKGCRLYLNGRSESVSSDSSPYPIAVVKTERIDPGYEDNSKSSDDPNWPGGQEDLEKLAQKYVENFSRPGYMEHSQSIVSEELPYLSSTAPSKNIYEVVKGNPKKKFKLPEGVVEQVAGLAGDSSTGPQAVVDTAPKLPHREPFLMVSRDRDGTVVLKKEKKIGKLSGQMYEEVTVKGTQGKSGKQAVGKSSGKSSTTGAKAVGSKSGDGKKVPNNKTQVKAEVAVSKSVECSVGTGGYYDDSDDEYDSDESSELGVYIENAEEEEKEVTTKSGRTSKRPSMYTESNVMVKRSRGRPRKYPDPMPDEEIDAMDDYTQYLSYEKDRSERRNQMYERKKKVVVDEKQYNNDRFKIIAPAGTVPKGCRSRYGRPELMKTKFISQTIHKGDGSVSVVTKEVPRRMTWHERQAEKKDAKEPTFVICHPTAPVVRP